MSVVKNLPGLCKAFAAGGLLVHLISCTAFADARRLSAMPDPRGEFIRLCAPFMVTRYAHPESICDCLRTALRGEIGDPDILDAILFGVTERGVPALDPAWLPREKRLLIGRTMTAVAEPTMECLFGSGRAEKALEAIPIDGLPGMPPVQDLSP